MGFEVGWEAVPKTPLLYFPFEENANDYSGNENHGTVEGATYVDAGRQGKALSFDGVDDYVLVNPLSPISNQTITIMYWIKPKKLDAQQNHMKIYETSTNWRYVPYMNSINIFCIWTSDGELSSGVEASLSVWYYIAVTYDGTTLKIFVNGDLKNSLTIALTNATLNKINGIGCDDGGNWTQAIFDDVRIYDKKLSEGEIEKYYEQGQARHPIVIAGRPSDDHLVEEGFRVHPEVTSAMSWAEIFLKNRCYVRGDTVLIYLDYKCIFDGIIKREQTDIHKWTAYAYDKLYRWRDEPCIEAGHYKYENQLAGTILVDLLTNYFPGEFNTDNVDARGTITHINGYGMYVHDFAQELARRSNSDFWLEPPYNVYFKEKETVSSGETVVYGTDILDITSEKDDLELRDQIIVQGRRFVKAIAGDGSSKYLHADESILTDAVAQEVADALLEQKYVTLVTGDVQLKSYRPDIRAGKTVVLDAPRWGFDEEVVTATRPTHTPQGTSFTFGDRWSATKQFSGMEGEVRRVKEYTLEDQMLKNNVVMLNAESLDGYQTYQSGNGGSTTCRKNYLLIHNNAGGVQAVYGYSVIPISKIPIYMKASVSISDDDYYVFDHVTVGSYLAYNCFGFTFYGATGGGGDGRIYGVCGDGDDGSSILLQAFEPNTFYELEAVFDGDSIKFYVDGIYKGQLTTYLPDSDLEDCYMWAGDAPSDPVAHDLIVKNFFIRFGW